MMTVPTPEQSLWPWNTDTMTVDERLAAVANEIGCCDSEHRTSEHRKTIERMEQALATNTLEGDIARYQRMLAIEQACVERLEATFISDQSRFAQQLGMPTVEDRLAEVEADKGPNLPSRILAHVLEIKRLYDLPDADSLTDQQRLYCRVQVEKACMLHTTSLLMREHGLQEG